jgi:hypothetical protein
MTISKESSALQTEQRFTVSNPFEFETSINSVKEKRRKSMRNPILACVIKQYGTGLYRTCVSFDKGHTVFLSAHPDEEGATETIDRFEEACRDGTIKTAEDLKGFAISLDLRGAACELSVAV